MNKTVQTHPVEILIARTTTPKVRADAAAKAARLTQRIRLGELRQRLGITQRQLSAALRITQPGLSKLERQSDMQISTLARAIQGMGGSLKLIAEFPDGAVELAGPTATEPRPTASVHSRKRKAAVA